ncbi:MAG: hypothetical protein AAGN66_27560 [Acidobacteriota bacterium]
MDTTWTDLVDAYLRLHHRTLTEIRRDWDQTQLTYLEGRSSERFLHKFRRWRAGSQWPFERLPNVTLVEEGTDRRGRPRVVVETDAPKARLAVVREDSGWRLEQAFAPGKPSSSGGVRWVDYFEARRERVKSFRSSVGKAVAINALSLAGRVRNSMRRRPPARELRDCQDTLQGYLRLWAEHQPALARRWHVAHLAFLERNARPELTLAYRAFWAEVERMMPEPTFPTPRLLRRSRGAATVSLSNFMALRGIPGKPTLPIQLKVSFTARNGRWLIDDAELPKAFAVS